MRPLPVRGAAPSKGEGGSEHPQFSRTSTGDQLYDRFDLEAYRVLGREVTKRLLANPPQPQASAAAAATAPGAALGAAVAVVGLAMDTGQNGEQPGDTVEATESS